MSRSCLLWPLLGASVLWVSACDPLPDLRTKPEDCELPVAPDGLLGEHGSSTLTSVCDREVCSQALPLAIGTMNEFTLSLDTSQDSPASQYALRTDRPDVLALANVDHSSELNGQYFEDGECLDAQMTVLSGSFTTLAPGTAQLIVEHAGKLFDSYTIVVDEASRMTVSAKSDLHSVDDVIAQGFEVTARDGAVQLRVHTFSAAGREVSFGDAPVRWDAGETGPVSLAPENTWLANGERRLTGRAVQIQADALGSAQVAVEVPGMHASVELRVTGIPAQPD